MAVIKPLAAVRPRPDLAAQICELPYDVVSSEEAREMAAGNPLSFFHVSKPEIDLPAGMAAGAPEVYAKGRENFQKLIREGALRADGQPCFYLYRQIMDGRAQTGIVAAASCADYLEGIVKKHELTRPDKEEDRLRHIEALGAQTGPVSLVYRAVDALDNFMARQLAAAPQVDFTARDGVRHSAWRIGLAEDIEFLEAQFARVPALYIADGHHRSAAAARVYSSRGGGAASPGESSRVLAVIFPHTRMRILPYNRVLRDFNGHSLEELLGSLAGVFDFRDSAPAPSRKHEVGLYLGGRWHTLQFKSPFTTGGDPLDRLDVTLLQKHVLGPIFGIDDPRTSRRIEFIGGIRGAGELERLVHTGGFVCAFSLFPTAIADLMAIADAGGILPPKSTWFEPKLRDGLFCHLI